MNLTNTFEEAMALYNKGELKKAKKEMNLIYQQEKNSSALNILAMIAYQEGDNETSLKYLRELASLEPNQAIYRNNLGVALLREDKLEEALSEFNEAVKLEKNYTDAYNNIGYVYKILGDFENSKEALVKAINLDSSNVLANQNIAELYKFRGDNANALYHYNQILLLDKKFLMAYLKIAEIQHELGAFNEALGHYKKALEIEPNLINDKFLKVTLHQIYAKLFPYDRFKFYNDIKKIEIFKSSLNRLSKDKNVLEYNTSNEAIFSLICAKNKANVILCNPEKFLLETTKEIAKKNNLDEQIKFINKEAVELNKGEIEKVDLLITDIFKETLPTYRTLFNINHLKNLFLKEDGEIFPNSFKLKAILIESKELYSEASANKLDDLDISLLNYYRPIYLYENINNFEYKKLTKEINLYEFNLKDTPTQNFNKDVKIDITSKGLVHSIVFWMEYNLDGKNFIDNGMNLKFNNSKQFIYTLDKELSVQSEEVKTLNVDYSDLLIFDFKEEA